MIKLSESPSWIKRPKLTLILPMQGQIRHKSTCLDEDRGSVDGESRSELLYLPRPSSSMIISESFVADWVEFLVQVSLLPIKMRTLIIVAVSNISAMKVETPFN